MSSRTSAEPNPVLERLQQYLKEKNPTEGPEEPPTLSPPPSRVDLNQNNIFSDEDRLNFDLLKQVLDYKKSLILRQPDVIEVLKTIAENHRK